MFLINRGYFLLQWTLLEVLFHSAPANFVLICAWRDLSSELRHLKQLMQLKIPEEEKLFCIGLNIGRETLPARRICSQVVEWSFWMDSIGDGTNTHENHARSQGVGAPGSEGGGFPWDWGGGCANWFSWETVLSLSGLVVTTQSHCFCIWGILQRCS